jgi:hypothetical protein
MFINKLCFYAPYLYKEGAGNVPFGSQTQLLLLLFPLSAVQRTILWPKMDEVIWEWRKLRNERLNDLYSSSNIVRVIKSRRMRLVGHVARMGERRGAYRVLVRTPEGKRPLGIPRRKWEDNIKMDLQEVGCRGMDWIDLAQVRDRWRAVMNLRVT